MSTRALYTFKKDPKVRYEKNWNVYKHHDGYPTGAAEHLTAALNFAWKLPRYESDEFAAAFIAANKPHWEDDCTTVNKDYRPGGQYHAYGVGGGVRLMPQGKPLTVASKNCSDIEYRYEVYPKNDELYVRAFRTSIAWRADQTTTDELIFDCSLKAMPEVAKEWTAKDRAAWEAKNQETVT